MQASQRLATPVVKSAAAARLVAMYRRTNLRTAIHTSRSGVASETLFSMRGYCEVKPDAGEIYV